MSQLDDDVIVAVATPPGRGGIGVLRLSGKGAIAIGEKLSNTRLKNRHAHFATFRLEDEVFDEGMILGFEAPRSFTGEDVVELHCHGSPVVLSRLTQAVCDMGARVARPGEFSERAFLNGKLDLAQAEAIADLIASGSAAASRAAVRSLQGEFSERVHRLVGEISDMRVLVEASIDFPEEEEDFLANYSIKERLEGLVESCNQLVVQTRQGVVQQTGITVALIGEPNAGKSSLLNHFSGEDTAIVTDIPGTTRDVLKVQTVIGGLPVTVVDTAGFREAVDAVEGEGVERAIEQAGQADLVILVLDGTRDQPAQTEAILKLAAIAGDDPRLLPVINKADLAETTGDGLWVSAKTGRGLDELAELVRQRAGMTENEAPFTARSRHVEALALCETNLTAAQAALHLGLEIIAEELRAAHDACGTIVGTVTPDDLLGRIFSEFCIGK